MKRVLSLLLLLLISFIFVFAKSLSKDDEVVVSGSFPKGIPTVYSTMSAMAMVHSKKARYKDIKILNSNGESVAIRFFFPTESSDKYMFLFSGLGGEGVGPQTDYLGEYFSDLGFNCVVLPNAFGKNFIEKISRDGRVGASIQDAQDSITFLNQLIQQQKLQEKELYISGLSHGALMALYISYLADTEKSIKAFNKVILMNPPPDIKTSLDKLKELAGEGVSTWSFFVNLVKYKWAMIKNESHQFSQSSYLQLIKDLKHIPQGELSTILGEVLLKKAKASKRESLDSLPPEGMFYLSPYLKASKKVVVLHNSNDFLLQKSESQKLKKLLGDRMYVFEDGGHLGNLWTKEYRQMLQKLLKNSF